MKALFPLIAAAAMLTACHTQKSMSLSLPDYDERPENKQPTLVRPAWPNYDLHNDRSFAAFRNIQTAPKDEGTRLQRLQYESNEFSHGHYTVYRCKDATYVAYDWYVPKQQDWWFFRFLEGQRIIDADTGDQYLLRGVEHFPTNQCFWIYGQAEETIRIVLVYPPLPLSVKRIQFYSPDTEARKWMNGTGDRSLVYMLDDLRPQRKAVLEKLSKPTHMAQPKSGQVFY